MNSPRSSLFGARGISLELRSTHPAGLVAWTPSRQIRYTAAQTVGVHGVLLLFSNSPLPLQVKLAAFVQQAISFYGWTLFQLSVLTWLVILLLLNTPFEILLLHSCAKVLVTVQRPFQLRFASKSLLILCDSGQVPGFGTDGAINQLLKCCSVKTTSSLSFVGFVALKLPDIGVPLLEKNQHPSWGISLPKDTYCGLRGKMEQKQPSATSRKMIHKSSPDRRFYIEVSSHGLLQEPPAEKIYAPSCLSILMFVYVIDDKPQQVDLCQWPDLCLSSKSGRLLLTTNGALGSQVRKVNSQASLNHRPNQLKHCYCSFPHFSTFN